MRIPTTKRILQGLAAALILLIAVHLTAPAGALAGDDDVPFFAGATGLPNVLFIFDNSDSMQDVPWPRKDGSTVRPSWRWRYGVKVDEDGTIAERDNGNIDYDYTKHVDTESQMAIPGRSPQPLPKLDGSFSLSGTITRLDRPQYIYDNTLDWTNSLGTSNVLYDSGTFNTNYRYRIIRVEDANGATQYRTITGRSTSGLFYFDRPNGDADNLDLTGAAPYTYTILTDTPGAVTRHYVRTDDRRGAYVFDANVDWTAVYADRSNWTNKLLVVTAGTNAGEQTRISWVSSSGYWYLDPPLPENSDLTTRYKIVGSADDNRYAYGGNHPESKLYQAKKALTTFLTSDAIKVCEEKDDAGNCTRERYLLNMGFGTYMTARVPRVRAWYYRRVAGDDPPPYYRFSGYYMQRRNASDRYYYNANGLMSFVVDNFDSAPLGSTDYIDDREYTNASVGMQFDRIYAQGSCNEQIIRYTVTEIQDVPTDSQPDRIRFRCRALVVDSGDLDLANPDAGGYVWFGWRNYDHATMEACTSAWNANGGGPPPIDGTYYLVPSDHANPYNGLSCTNAPVECHEIDPPETGTYYDTYRRDTYGDYNTADPDTPGYIDRDTLMVTPYKGYCNGSWNTPGCTPDPEAGQWTLMTEDLIGVPINSSGEIDNIAPYQHVYDYSYFRYPGEGTADRPHAWSYRRTADGYVYRYSYSYASTWEDGIQADPFFPAAVGDEEANHTGDDHLVFVNLPAYDATDLDYRGDDASGQNLSKILNYVSLTRVTDPNDTRYDKTMMPETSSLPVNQYQRITGKGTPLGASLDNAYQYYTSYIAQDDFTQGGCRNNYVILLTDGLETCDGDPAAAAETLLNMSINDRPAPVKTFVIGFGLGEESKETLNTIAEAGGTGQAYFAKDVDELVDVLTSDILAEIAGGSYTRSAPVVTRVLEAGDQLKIFYAYFDYPVWRGHLEGYLLDEDGIYDQPIPAWTGSCTGDATRADAGCKMADLGRGTVYTRLADGGRIEFNAANAAQLAAYVNPSALDINGDGTAGDTLDAQTIIGYTLNPRHDGNRYVGTRDATQYWPLGDIYSSKPSVVTEPKFSMSYRGGYGDFKGANAERPTMIYVGANDGMLHAFYESTGAEAWAYVPAAVLGTVAGFSDGHRFTVDLTPRIADIDLSSGGTDWRTILVGGLRKGGNHYFALDVTSPLNPQPLWEMTDDNMGRTWSVPNFGRIRIKGDDTSVVFVGGGYSTDAGRGNRVYILDAASGDILEEFEVGAENNNVPSEVLAVAYRLNGQGYPVDHKTQEVLSAELRGFIEVLYFGDTSGSLWKVSDLNTEGPWRPSLEKLFTPPAEQRRPIYHAPTVKIETRYCSKRFVYFGTGDENAPVGIAQNYYYEIVDRPYDDDVGGPDYGAEWTAEKIEDGLFRMTWQYTLPYGEQVLSDSTYYNNVIYFTTYQPQGGCEMGYSFLYGLTASPCGGSGGGSGGIEYGIDDEALEPRLEKIDLGRSIATSPTIAPPRMFLQKPGGGGQGLPPPVSFKIPLEASRMLYWRER